MPAWQCGDQEKRDILVVEVPLRNEGSQPTPDSVQGISVGKMIPHNFLL